MQIDATAISGAVVVAPRRHGDERGFFAETYNRAAWAAAGVDLPPLREESILPASVDNRLESFAYQRPPRARGQLVRCAVGAVRAVVAEARRGAPNYGAEIEVDLGAADGRQLWVPAGCLAAFRALSEGAQIVSNATDFLVPELGASAPRGLAGWNSPFEWTGAA